MKKFKIFLLLSILLCFGLILSSEVHAEEETNVTDLTGTKWVLNENITTMPNGALIDGDVYAYETFNLSFISNSNVYSTLHFQDGDYGANWERGIYYDTTHVFQYSAWTNEAYRTIKITGGIDVTNTQLIAWFESNATLLSSTNTPKKFEIGDVLPAGYIKISWDFTGVPFGDNDDFWIYSSDDFFIHIWKIDRLIIDIMNEEFFANTPGEIVITLSSPCTITSFDGDSNYYEYIDEALSWEVADYTDGYRDGYDTARRHYGWVDDNGHWYTADEWGIMSYEHAREEFGYYDPITERWLSVEEYLDLYTGQDGFYNNFDKYFIPAMIIVFGGAIVLTILKVFKGRE